MKEIEKFIIKLKHPYVIVFAHKKGGVGKTSTACNVAVEFHKRNYPLSVIDLDSQKQTTKFNNKRKDPFHIEDINNADQLVKFLKADKGLTIIDLGGYDSDLSRTTLLLADMVIIPLSDSDNELDGLLEFKKIMVDIQARQSGIDCNVLVTRVHHADNSTHKALKGFVESIDGFNIFDTVLRTRKEYKRMLGTGKSVTEQTKGSGSIELLKLIDEIEVKING